MILVCKLLACIVLLYYVSVCWTEAGPYNVVGVVRADAAIISNAGMDSQQADRAVIAFLHWYRSHLLAVNRYPLVNQPDGKPYSVNLKNGERYLATLKESHLLTDGYLNQWRTYFRERNEGFWLNPQEEGPPNGFEYDLVMLTQDVDKQLATLKSLKITHTKVVKNRATVSLTLLGAYKFRLVRQNRHRTRRSLILDF